MTNLPLDLIRISKVSQNHGVYAVLLKGQNKLHNLTSLECDVVVYPYSNKISAANVNFMPFEDYITDILSGQKSIYSPIQSAMDKLFGLLLGLALFLYVFLIRRQDLFSVESVASIVGVYLVGKELWVDLENYFINVSKKWRVRYYPEQYSYTLETDTTLANYTRFARKRRYHRPTIMPLKIDLVQQSNSHTAKMYIDLKNTHVFDENKEARLMLIQADELAEPEFDNHNCLFGVKLSLNRQFLGIRRSLELFQSLDNLQPGCLDSDGKWVAQGVFYRVTFMFGRLKLYWKSDIVTDLAILHWD